MSEKLSITARVPAKAAKDGNPAVPELGPVTIIVNNGSTAKEQIEMFGDEAVHSQSTAAWSVTVQGNIRSGLKKGENQNTIQARLGEAKMGVATKGAKVDPIQAYLLMFQNETPENQKDMVKELTKRAAVAAEARAAAGKK